MQRSVFSMVLMLMAGASYGLVSPILRFAYAKGFSAADMTNAQYGLASVVLWILVLVRQKGSPIRKNQWLLLIVLGLFAAAVSYCYYMSLTVLPASIGTVLLFQFAWMATLIDIVVKRTLPGKMKWLGLLVIIGGTVLAVNLGGSGLQNYPLWAIRLGLLAAFSYAMTLYLSGFANEGVSPFMRSAIVVTVGMLFMFIPFRPTYLISGVLWHGLLTWGGLIAILGQVAPMLLMLVAIPRIGGRMAAILGTIELPVSVFTAWLLDKDVVLWSQWLGVILILIGILISESDAFLTRSKQSRELEMTP